jgi:hypothetical protein
MSASPAPASPVPCLPCCPVCARHPRGRLGCPVHGRRTPPRRHIMTIQDRVSGYHERLGSQVLSRSLPAVQREIQQPAYMQ